MSRETSEKEIRKLLASRGYRLGLAGRWHGTDLIWDVSTEPGSGLPPAHYLLNMKNRTWAPLDHARSRGWYRWEQGPWHELAEPIEESESDVGKEQQTARSGAPAPSVTPSGLPSDPAVLAFFDQCIAAGFTWDPRNERINHTIDGWDTGNRFLIYQGRSYLALGRLQKIHAKVNGAFASLPLPEFLALQRVESAPAPNPPPQSPSLAAVRVVVQTSGRLKQKGLF